LVTLRVLVRVDDRLRPNKNPFNGAWTLLRINRGDFLMAPADREPRIVSTGRSDWIGLGQADHEPVDELATRMTAKVINEVAADVLCVVEAEDRPSLVRFNADRYAHRMLGDGTGILPAVRR
jgi:hypothetical protein